MKFKHIGSFYYNKSEVECTYRGSSSTSIPVARLLRFLAIQQQEIKASSLTPMSIAGKYNEMEEIPLLAFKDGNFAESQKNITSYFNYNLPLPQNQSWKEYMIPEKLASRVIVCLC